MASDGRKKIGYEAKGKTKKQIAEAEYQDAKKNQRGYSRTPPSLSLM